MRQARGHRPRLQLHHPLNLLPRRGSGKSPAVAVVKQVAYGARSELSVENFDLITGNQSRMTDAAGPAELKYFLSQGDDVIGEPRRFQRGIQAVHQPRVLRGNAGRAVSRVAALRL